MTASTSTSTSTSIQMQHLLIYVGFITTFILSSSNNVHSFVLQRGSSSSSSSRSRSCYSNTNIESQQQFTKTSRSISKSKSKSTSTSTTLNLTPLPKGISPFEKSVSKSLDIQQTFRQIAKKAVDNAISSKSTPLSSSSPLLLELEFPPLLGGSKTKSQFDDFDNIQELDSNKDWAVQFAPLFTNSNGNDFTNGKTWLTFPDVKECELAKKEWQGGLYQKATYTTIEAATEFLMGSGSYSAPWGAALANGVNKIMSGGGGGGSDGGNVDDKGSNGNGNDAGLLGDKGSLDALVSGENSPPTMNLVIQPGNGGPVEDWINCEKIHLASPESVMVIVNGALDKVRDGYYPGVFFPKLAATVDRFYKKFESAFYLKPISDKGVYGWLYRVYPEPWQVVLQTVKTDQRGQPFVEDKIVSVSDERPSYNEAVAKLLEGAREESLK